MRSFLHSLIVASTILFLTLTSFSQSSGDWSAEYVKPKSFITNVGQFDQAAGLIKLDGVEYAYDGTNQMYYFTKSGLVIELSQKHKVEKSEEEKAERELRKQQPFTTKEWQDFESVGNRITYNRDVLNCNWIGSNTDVELIAENADAFYHSYTFNSNAGVQESVNHVKSYKKLTYKNLYDHIDVVYVFHPEGGIKYSVIVHPGGDLSQVKLNYSKPASLLPDGTIHTPTLYGDIIDHAPVTFYDGNENQSIQSSYIFENNTISFQVADFDHSRTLVIDPWVQAPTFASNWDCVWECEKDGAGNVYIIGGVTPMQLLKYNNAGVLQWTYNTPYDTTMWLGCFATDDVGNSYVANGSTAAIQKINNAGGVVWNNGSPGGLFGSTEFWNIAFNCDQTMLVIGGTGGFLPPLPYIYNMDMGTGNVISSVQVCESTIAGIPPNTQEVRAITATANEKYYFLTQDTIGYVDQNMTLCPGTTAPFHIDNGIDLGYKCENWRYNNTGMEALAYFDDFIYVNRGDVVQKRAFATGAIVATAPIPGGSLATVFLGGKQAGNSGIEIDACGNVFVGSTNQVVKFDQNLVQLGTFATTFNVYDVSVSTAGDVIAAGSTGNSGSASRTGRVQSFAGGACAPQTIVCCNPFICPVEPVCSTDPAFVMSTDTPGGTFTISPATPGFNTGTGAFNPALAAPGTYTITYTLLCGSESTTVTVSACSAMSVCEETNGTITVTGGSPIYTWASEQLVSVGCVPGGGIVCGFFTVAAPPTLQWVNFGTGTNVTPPGGATSIQITDGNGTVFVFDPNTIPLCSTPCDATINAAGPFCINAAAVNLTSVTPGGTWSGTGITNASLGTFNPATAGAGTHTITYTLLCGGTDTQTITVNALTTPTFAAVAPICSGAPLAALPTTSTNGITGTWSPAINNTATTTYTFTPTAGLCASTTTLTITVNSNVTPTFAAVAPICSGAPLAALPTTSTNGITGTWSPAINNTATTTYTFTPTAGQCATTTTLTITVNPNVTPTFAAVAPICSGAPLAALPTTSTNAITGTWSPAINNTATTTYTFTPTAGQCATTTTMTITVNPADNSAFTYTSGSFCVTDPNPSPTITGLVGGTFTISGVGVISAGTGVINLGASGNGTFTVTYTTAGACPSSSTFDVTITSGADATITAAGPFCSTDAAVNLVGADAGGAWTGAGITNGVLGTFDPAIAGAGVHVITYTIGGGCGDVDTENITVNASDDASFNYATASYCITDPNPSAVITGTLGGTFTISGGGTINAASGLVDIALTGLGTFTVTYTTASACPASSTFDITITNGADATITPAGPFCTTDAAINLVAVDAGGTWTGTGITDGVLGTFDPAIAGAGVHIITYTIGGGCGDVDTENITVSAVDNSSFTYASASFCTTDPNPSPTITGVPGGTFTISGGASINATTGIVDIALSGLGTFTVTYTTTGTCPSNSTFDITITNGADATITAAGPFCANASAVNLVAADPGGTWTGTGITNGVLGTFDPATAGAGVHIITYTIGGGCGDVDTENITVNAIDNASFTYPSAIYCLTDPNPSPTITGTPGGTFTISGAGVINAATGVINLGASGAGAFVVTYTTAGPCPASTTFNVTLTNSSNATITAAGPFCADDPAINLTAATPGGTWSGTGITDPIAGTFNPATAGAGSHTVTYTIAGGCGATDTQVIIVNPVDGAAIFYGSANYCSTDIDPFVSITGTLGGTFTISSGGVINSFTGVIDLSASAPGAYTITYTTNGPCPAVATFNVTIGAALVVDILEVGPLCLGSGDVGLIGSPSGGTWQGHGIWDLPNGIFNPDTAGVGLHEIIYTVAGLCGDDDTIIIEVSGPPVAEVSNDTLIFIGDEAPLWASGGTSYFWYEDQDITCTNCQYPVVNPLETTTYCAVVTNAAGCIDTACVVITVDQNCGDLFVPNAFSPDGNGHYDNNMECVYGRCIVSMKFTIYDRWGEVVFVTESQDICWDGMFRGKPMNSGIYVYILEATLLTGEYIEQKGNITLVR